MPTDLDEFFTAMRDDSNAVPLPPPSAAGDLGRRRNRRKAALAGAAAVVLVVSGAVGLTRPGPAPDDFGSTLPRVGDATIPVGGAGGATMPQIRIADGRAFALWREGDGTLRLAAADLSTGKAAWRTHTLAKLPPCGNSPSAQAPMCPAEQGIEATARGVLVTFDTETTGSSVLGLDPATGRTRWQASWPAGLRTNAWVAGSSTVMIDVDDRVEARDLTTGRSLWQLDTDQDNLRSTFEAAGDGGRMVTRDLRDGTLTVRDLRTGALEKTVPGSRPLPRNYIGFDDADNDRILFNDPPDADQKGRRPYRLETVDLNGTAGARTVYRSPAGRFGGFAQLCGPDLICVMDLPLRWQDDKTGTQIAGVRISDGKELWRVGPTPSAQMTAGGPASLLVGSRPDAWGSRPGRNALYDLRDGRQLLGPADQEAIIDWTGPDHLLSFRDGEVARIDAATGDRKTIGELPPGLDPGHCSLAADRLVCPVNGLLAIWRTGD